jgi:chloramphenicol-sensitive protein RarD
MSQFGGGCRFMENPKKNSLAGICFSLSAGILWGIVPVYIKFIDADDPYEIVAHRSLWSAVLLFIICWIAGQLGEIWVTIKQPKNLLNFFITTFFLSLNWGIYVYAVQTGQVVSAALGYFIYPLCTVLLGILVLGERLDKWAWLAIGLVCLGVMAKAMMIMDVPWISLALAGSFSLYAVIRKRMDMDPLQGLFIETLFLLPFAIGFLFWMATNGQVPFFGGGAVNIALALLAGGITVLPLVLFLKGNRALNMTMASLLFYSNPTMQLLLGVMVFSEEFMLRDLVAFWADMDRDCSLFHNTGASGAACRSGTVTFGFLGAS